MGGVKPPAHPVIPAHLVTLGLDPRVCLRSAKDARVRPEHDEMGLAIRHKVLYMFLLARRYQPASVCSIRRPPPLCLTQSLTAPNSTDIRWNKTQISRNKTQISSNKTQISSNKTHISTDKARLSADFRRFSLKRPGPWAPASCRGADFYRAAFPPAR